MRDVGKMGENFFEAWCNSVGLTANMSRIDKTGWDYLVEFPVKCGSGHPLDLRPPPLECRIQVKSTDKCRMNLKMSLQNFERLIKTSMPTFVCVFHFESMDTPQRAYLIHMGEEIIRRTLKRLREQEVNTGKSVRRPTLSITYSNPEKLMATNGACLKQAIETHVPEGLEKYHQWKNQLLSTLGYEHGHGYIKMQVSSADPVMDLIDLSLGLRKNLKVTDVSIHDTRFEADRILRQCADGVQLSVGPAILKGTLRFRKQKSSPGIEFAANIHNPSVNQVVPRERIKFRLETQFFEILIEPFKGTVQFKLMPEIYQIYAILSELKEFLSLLCMLGAQDNKFIWMDVTVNNRPFLPEGKILQTDIRAPKEELEIVQHALHLARKYEIDRKALVSLQELIESRESISIFYNMVENANEELTATFIVDNKLQITDTSGVIFRTCLLLGEYFLYWVFGITGCLVQIGDKHYKLTSRDKCFQEQGVIRGNQETVKAEMDELATNIKLEMEAKGISQVIFFENPK